MFFVFSVKKSDRLSLGRALEKTASQSKKARDCARAFLDESVALISICARAVLARRP
jgi:hypothetical protein